MKVLKEKYFNSLESLIRSSVLWAETVFLTFFYSFTILIVFCFYSFFFDRERREIPQWLSSDWSRSILRWSQIWRIVVTGKKNIQKGKHYIVVANHQSMLDILAVNAALPLNFKFLAKKELFDIPFMGWGMAAIGYIPVNRASSRSGLEAIRQISNCLGKNVSVLLFPEGTRSPDGEIYDFKMGAFKIARDHRAEILPIVIDGTGQALPKNSWLIRKKSAFVVSIGKPIPLEGISGEKLADAKESIRLEMIERLQLIRKGEK